MWDLGLNENENEEFQTIERQKISADRYRGSDIINLSYVQCYSYFYTPQ